MCSRPVLCSCRIDSRPWLKGASATIPTMTTSMSLGELARRLNADLVNGVRPAEDAGGRTVTGVAGIESATPTQVSFVANPKYASLARKSQAAALIVEPGFAALETPTLRVGNPKLAFTQAVTLFHPAPRFPPMVHSTAVIADSARLGARAHVGPFAVIGDGCVLGEDAVVLAHAVLYSEVTAGDRLLVHAHAVVREGCRLGNDVVIGNGSIIGGDGFGFAKETGGRWVKTLHPCPVVLEDEVEVQSNTCIDRSVVGETRIAKGTKIDNLVQVGHASTVGEQTLLCAQVGLAGSTHIGKNVILAGQVGVAGHLTVGDRVIATAQTGIPSDVAPGSIVSGYPAMDNRAWLRMVAALQRVPEMLRKVRAEEKA